MNNSPSKERRKAETDYLSPFKIPYNIDSPAISKNSRLVINSNEPHSTEEDNINEEAENSNMEIIPVKIKKHTSTTDDYVELPKIMFSKEELSINHGNNSVLNMEMKMEESSISEKQIKQIINQDEVEQQQSEQGEEWARWNVNNIKIIPSQNNFMLQQQMQIPSTLSRIKKQQRRETRNDQKSFKEQRLNRSKNLSSEKEIHRDRQRRERQRNIEMVSNFLSGKASVIWLFILGPDIEQSQLVQIKQIYKDYIEKDYEVPICRSYEDASRFLNLNNCFFKVIVDMKSSEALLEESQKNKNIVAIYLYNPRKEAGITQTFELKRMTRKIKGMFMNLQQAAEQAYSQIQNQAKFIRVGDELERQRNKLRFPSFVMLSEADSSTITAYRLCLYGALKLTQRKQRLGYLKQFTDMVEMRYEGVVRQLQYLQQYKKIDHASQNSEQKIKNILKFYVKQSFYYALTNSILRLSKSAEEFRPCTIPFNQTYHAIRQYYLKYRNENGGKIRKMVTYRGAKLRTSDVKSLQVGNYIELLGFTSTSLLKTQAEKFMDNDSYLIQIIVEKAAENDKQLQLDHGFVQINHYGLAAGAFQNEQEVLFNSLNIFKVIALDLQSAIRKITIQYGAIFDLLRSKDNDLTPSDRAVIANYKYCSQTFDKIEDDGDVLLLAQEHTKCVEYYQNKIDEGQKNAKNYGKLANVQLESGDLDSAYDNAMKSLSLMDKEAIRLSKDSVGEQVRLMKNAKVFDEVQDMPHYQLSIKKCLKLNISDWLTKVRLLKQRGQKRMKMGDMIGCQKDLQKCRLTILEKEASFSVRRKQVERRYLIRSLCCCICSRGASNQLQEHKQLQLLNIQQDQIDFQRHKQELYLVNLQIETVSKELAQLIKNKQMYNASQDAASQNYNKLTKKSTAMSPITIAKYQTLQASALDTQQHQSQYEALMQSAIEKVKQYDMFHRDVGIYSKILGTKRLASIKKKLQMVSIREGQFSDKMVAPEHHTELVEPSFAESQKYNYQEYQTMYQKCKNSFRDAANNVVYNKGSQNAQFLEINNNIAELQFDFTYVEQSETIAASNSKHKIAHGHTEGAKCFMILAKISLSKGEIKHAFKLLQKSYQILRSVLLKVDNKQYNQIFLNNPLYMQINLLKVKVFNRQMKHDLALKQLLMLKKIAKIQIDKNHSKIILATIYEEQAQILVCLGQTDQFQQYLIKAIELRQAEMGKYNIPNAICYANLFKYLKYLNDFQEALNYHYKATEIFSRFPSDHPNAWMIHLSNALIFHHKNEYDLAISHMQYCLKVANQKFSSNHITLMKIHLQYGKLLVSMKKPQAALRIFQNLQKLIEQNMKRNSDQKIQKQIDDQKLTVRKNLIKEMKELYALQANDRMTSLLAIQKCEKQLKEYQSLFPSSDHLISHKSINQSK